MTNKEFLRTLANGKTDIVQVLLDILAETQTRYCVIGGLAVNAYVEPVVSLDLDIIVSAEDVAKVAEAAARHDLKTEMFPHSANLSSADSALRIQLQLDARYQPFTARAQERDVLGYQMQVAAIEDLLQGKVWAYLDPDRRGSKRQKDLADILRLVESYPELAGRLPEEIKNRIE